MFQSFNNWYISRITTSSQPCQDVSDKIFASLLKCFNICRFVFRRIWSRGVAPNSNVHFAMPGLFHTVFQFYKSKISFSGFWDSQAIPKTILVSKWLHITRKSADTHIPIPKWLTCLDVMYSDKLFTVFKRTPDNPGVALVRTGYQPQTRSSPENHLQIFPINRLISRWLSTAQKLWKDLSRRWIKNQV